MLFANHIEQSCLDLVKLMQLSYLNHNFCFSKNNVARPIIKLVNYASFPLKYQRSLSGRSCTEIRLSSFKYICAALCRSFVSTSSNSFE